MLNVKAMIIPFNIWVDKKDSINEWIFLEPKPSGGRLDVELDLSNYETKADLKSGIHQYIRICWKGWFIKAKKMSIN